MKKLMKTRFKFKQIV